MIFIAIGSNLESKEHGSPEENCKAAIKVLKENFYVEKISKFYKTEPIPKSDQPWFVNVVISVKTEFSPEQILRILLSIEANFKRERKKKNEARVIDLDLLSYNNKVLNSKNLTLPHPRMHLRKFVIKPLCDIDNEWKHPRLKKKAKIILKELALQKIMNIN
mgnify:FL=1